MKKKLNLRFIVTLMVCMLSVSYMSAQQNAETVSCKTAKKWCKSGEWRNGFKATPYKTTDLKEFYSQYHKNKALWDKLFTWLGSHNLETIEAGQYAVDGEHCFVKVSDVMTRPLDKCGIESHRRYIDLQYVAKGTERFGRIKNMSDATPKAPYKPDIINYTSDKVKYMNSRPDIFFLFFPSNLHVAMGQAGAEPEQVRLIVAKIEYTK